jgi:hypothetical protein
VASISSSTTWADSIACRVLTTENFSIASNTLPLAAQAGGVDQLETLAVALERHHDGVARGAGLVEGDQRSSPSQVLISVDLPTLGRPATASRPSGAGTGDVVVLSGHACARVDHKDHDIGLGDGLTRLLGHLHVDAALGRGLEAAGVNHDVLVLALDLPLP